MKVLKDGNGFRIEETVNHPSHYNHGGRGRLTTSRNILKTVIGMRIKVVCYSMFTNISTVHRTRVNG